jgi:uncharacterized protein with HEPN domain
MAERDIRVYLDDILESISKIEEYLKDVTELSFEINFEKQDAVIRRFEIIGEAVKQIPASVKNKYPEIPWRKIAGLRDISIHNYFGLSPNLVWKVAKEDAPDLKRSIQKVKNDLS